MQWWLSCDYCDSYVNVIIINIYICLYTDFLGFLSFFYWQLLTSFSVINKTNLETERYLLSLLFLSPRK